MRTHLLGCIVALGTCLGTATAGEPQQAIGVIHPAISPDGQTIAFSYQGNIWSVPRNGGTMRRLTRGKEFHCQPAWSRDGKRIAYTQGWQGRLWLLDVDSLTTKVHSNRYNVAGPILFTPSGQQVVAGVHGQGGWQATLIDLQSGATRPLNERTTFPPITALSPNGDEVLIAEHLDIKGNQFGAEGPYANLMVKSLLGDSTHTIGQTPSRVVDVTWTGDTIIYSSDVGGAHKNLWSIDLNENHPHHHRLTHGFADELEPTVSDDGRWLAYLDNNRGAGAIMVRDLDNGTEQPVTINAMDYGSATGTLRITTVDRRTGQPVAARLAVESADGGYHAPVGALYRLAGPMMYFYGEIVELTVPAGKTKIHAFRGTEYRDLQQGVEVAPGAITEVTITIEQWVQPDTLGWYSGESHIHANYTDGHWYQTPESVRLQIQGEGLNAANMVIANSDSDGIYDREFWRGRPDPVSTPKHIVYWNEEFRSTLWGHLTLYNLKQLVEPIMTGFLGTTNPHDVPTNSDIADHVHQQGGHVNYAHPANTSDPFIGAYAAKAMPIDVALGKIDSLDINHSYRHAVPLWYRLLNCGFKLPASAGTDCFLNQIANNSRPGRDRAYVKLGGKFTYESWVAGLAAGRSFVTNGPWLTFSANDHALGDTITLDAAGEIQLKASASWQYPLNTIQVVHNGQVIATGKISNNPQSIHLDRAITISTPGWLSARVFGDGNVQAHTSPIYITIAGQRATSAEDASYFLQWINRLETALRERKRLPSKEAWHHVMHQLDHARAVYARIVAGEGP